MIQRLKRGNKHQPDKDRGFKSSPGTLLVSFSKHFRSITGWLSVKGGSDNGRAKTIREGDPDRAQSFERLLVEEKLRRTGDDGTAEADDAEG